MYLMKRLIIAEIGHNHRGNMQIAKNLIRSAKNIGCDIAKFQLYDIDRIKKPGDTNYDELKKAQLTQEDMFELHQICLDVDIEFLCSCFDVKRLKWYLETDPKHHKIASRSIFNARLIDAMLKSDVPIIASLGAWEGEIFPPFRAQFLFCRSRRDILRDGLVGFPKKFNGWHGYDGFSDHTIGIEYAIQALHNGAKIIEKHYTFDQNWPGWDQPSSATPEEMLKIVQVARTLEEQDGSKE